MFVCANSKQLVIYWSKFTNSLNFSCYITPVISKYLKNNSSDETKTILHIASVKHNYPLSVLKISNFTHVIIIYFKPPINIIYNCSFLLYYLCIFLFFCICLLEIFQQKYFLSSQNKQTKKQLELNSRSHTWKLAVCFPEVVYGSFTKPSIYKRLLQIVISKNWRDSNQIIHKET